ncbi:MAG: hypothetical protein ACREEM_55540 [Blastocatellia bacterium]
MKFDSDEAELLLRLDTLLQRPAMDVALEPIVARVEKKLAEQPRLWMAWESVPLDLYVEALPAEIQSSWVFILRAGAPPEAERHRHPNSRQRVVSYRGSGDLQVWRGDGDWQSNPLVSDAGASLDCRWASIPVNVWHQVVVTGADWVVVSFHTVPAEALLEERPDTGDPALARQRSYL